MGHVRRETGVMQGQSTSKPVRSGRAGQGGAESDGKLTQTQCLNSPFGFITAYWMASLGRDCGCEFGKLLQQANARERGKPSQAPGKKNKELDRAHCFARDDPSVSRRFDRSLAEQRPKRAAEALPDADRSASHRGDCWTAPGQCSAQAGCTLATLTLRRAGVV